MFASCFAVSCLPSILTTCRDRKQDVKFALRKARQHLRRAVSTAVEGKDKHVVKKIEVAVERWVFGGGGVRAFIVVYARYVIVGGTLS